MKIKDKNGKVRNVSLFVQRCAVVSAYDIDTGEPYYSEAILDTGEGCAVMKHPDFRKNKELISALLEAKRSGLLSGTIKANDGSLWCHVHPSSKVNESMPQMGMKLEVVEIDGKKWNKWYIPLELVFDNNVEKELQKVL